MMAAVCSFCGPTQDAYMREITRLRADVERLRNSLSECEPHLRRLSARDGGSENVPSLLCADRALAALAATEPKR